MAQLYILDTDHVSLLQNGNRIITKRISKKNPENLAVTVITLEEKMKGWLNEINKSNNEAFRVNSKLLWAYKGLADEINFFNNIQLLAFDNRAYEMYQSLVIQKLKRIGTQDLRIAAIAKSVNGIVVTRNWRDFENVPGLILEDWTIS
ncbi:type II toxin-antitoxin system VapC family toxin [Nostoc sp. UHCC 0870]|uniref:type II toxin-antitoxin system VapC family toxin n=1 Tax=Nostoc sp. UHCC 0870 TaxID=2914041 RepID=UPI001EDDB9AD|nr:type II toxin-antitoxin system VapC family toxin [Nostoc sp. UHCC 0870]UKO97035.1 type II toxin-antitoxin system VapC family toxin [Nostoc sp. UHCC 0870]